MVTWHIYANHGKSRHHCCAPAEPLPCQETYSSTLAGLWTVRKNTINECDASWQDTLSSMSWPYKMVRPNLRVAFTTWHPDICTCS